jgi:acetyl-CoA hydrolase
MIWEEGYRTKVTSAEEALKCVRSGGHVWIHAGCCNPEELVRAMVARASELRNVTVSHLLTFGCADYVDPRHRESFRHRSLFTGANVREAINDGRADFVPVFLSEIPRLITSDLLPVDVALVHLSPPDEHGFCSFGVASSAPRRRPRRRPRWWPWSTGRCRGRWAIPSSTSRA